MHIDPQTLEKNIQAWLGINNYLHGFNYILVCIFDIPATEMGNSLSEQPIVINSHN